MVRAKGLVLGLCSVILVSVGIIHIAEVSNHKLTGDTLDNHLFQSLPQFFAVGFVGSKVVSIVTDNGHKTVIRDEAGNGRSTSRDVLKGSEGAN